MMRARAGFRGVRRAAWVGRVLAAALAGMASAGAAPAAAVINVGDRLRYHVLEDGDPPVELVVGNTGMVELPYHGPLLAAGRSLPELTAAVKTALEEEFYVQATVRLSVIEVRLAAVNRGRVHLSGQVRKIGPVDIDMAERNTLGRVILASGGLAEFADDRRVRVVRRDPGTDTFKTIVVDLREVLERGRIEKDIELQDGDFVIVDERLIKW